MAGLAATAPGVRDVHSPATRDTVDAGGVDSSNLPEREPNLVGKTLRDTYQVMQVLDRGGMGTVYEAEHLRLHRRVAIKVLARHLTGHPSALERFQREAEIISQLVHPHVVQVLDYNSTELGQPYLVMELLCGESLAARLDRQRVLPLAEAVRITAQVASALRAAHELQIVHRDLKPQNVFLLSLPGEPPYVKLLDFGISKRATAGQRITREFAVLGTPEYMAPEQALGHSHEVDHRADQFALAALAYEMLSGRQAFWAEDVAATLYQVIHEQPAPVSHVGPPWLPPSIDAVLAKGLEKDPANRYANVSELAVALTDAAGLGYATRDESQAAPPLSRVEPSAKSQSYSITTPIDRTHRVAHALERARMALERGELDIAVHYCERALEAAEHSTDPAAIEALRAAGNLLERVFVARLGGTLGKPLRVCRVPSVNDTELTATQAYLVSRLDQELTLEEILDVSALPRRATLRELVKLRRLGIVDCA